MDKKNFFYVDEIHIPIIIWDIIKNAWLAILAAIAVCIGIFAYNTLAFQPAYSPEITFAVSPRSNGSYVGFYSSLSTAKEMAGVFKEVFASDVLQRLIKEDLQQPNLSFSVSAEIEEDTNILRVTAQADTPEKAHAVIQSVMRNYRRVSGYLFGGVVLDVLRKPQISVTPSNALNLPRTMGIGAVLAVICMMGIIALISIIRPTAKTLTCVKRHMDEMPIGVLQKERRPLHLFRKQEKRPPLITDTTTSFHYTESLLQIAHKVRHEMSKSGMKVLLVTSVAENEGKSTVSANLALALSRHGHKVAYVDMDLRKPAVHKIFGQYPREDLLTCLKEGPPASLDSPERLHILSLTGPCSRTDHLLHGEGLVNLLNTLRKKMDFVILDSSPYTATADAGMLLQHADCCVMIMRQDWVAHRVCRDVAEDLAEGTKYLGYVFNHYLDDGTAKALTGRYGRYGRYGKYGAYGYYKKNQAE